MQKHQWPWPHDPSRKRLADPRILDYFYQQGLLDLCSDLHYRGGVGYLKDTNGTIIGRTNSINPPWFQQLVHKHYGLVPRYSTIRTCRAVEAALLNKPLGRQQRLIVEALLDIFEEMLQDIHDDSIPF